MDDVHTLSVRVLRINVEPKDAGPGPTWLRAAAVHPWLRRRHLSDLISAHPSMPTTEFTTLTPNVDAWASMSDYLEEMANDRHATLIQELMTDGRMTCDVRSGYAQEEILEMARPITLFKWERPIMRMATHVAIRSATSVDRRAAVHLSERLGGAVLTRLDEEWLSLLAPGSPDLVPQTVHEVLRPGMEAPRAW